MSEQQSEVELIQGTMAAITQKAADKWQVEVSSGGNYNRKLWTKDAALVAALQPKLGQHVAFVCGVSNWTNNEGKPVRSLWINGFQDPQQAPPAAAEAVPVPAQPAVQAPVQPVPQAPPPSSPVASPQEPAGRYSPEEINRFEEKERRDFKSRAWAQTLAAFNHTITVGEDPLEVYARLKPFQSKVYIDICGMFALSEDEMQDVPF